MTSSIIDLQVSIRSSESSHSQVILAKYAGRGDLHLSQIELPDTPSSPYKGYLLSTDEQLTEVFVNPSTGKIIGERILNKTLKGMIFELHYSLMAGKTGTVIVGIAAFLMCVLTITGLLLWPGWRKLIAGFKIKLDANRQRANFDIHKVAGIITVVSPQS